MWDFVCLSLEMSIELFFFPLVFSGYFCSVDACAVCILAVISLLPRFFLCSRCIDALTPFWMLTNPLPPSFLDSYNLFISSLGSQALCIVMSFFFVLWSMCWSSLLVHFKNGSKYFTGWGDSPGVYLFDEIFAM